MLSNNANVVLDLRLYFRENFERRRRRMIYVKLIVHFCILELSIMLISFTFLSCPQTLANQ